MVQTSNDSQPNVFKHPTRRSFLEGGALLLLGSAGRLAFAADAVPARQFKFERVSNHVYGAIAQTTPVVNGNSAIIVTQKGLVVVDSQSSPAAARSLYDQFKQEFETLPVRYLINTHHHLDHAHGNAAYAEMFGSRLDIVSTGFCRAALEQATRWFNGFLQGKSVPSAQLQMVSNQERYYQFVQDYIGGLKKQMPAIEAQTAHLDGPKKAAERIQLEALRSYFSEMSEFAPTLPNITFDRELRLHCGDVTVNVRYLGRGHTAGDAVVLIPEDRVIVTGDLVHGLEPLLLDAYPDEWPATLDRVAELDFDIVVPGHGPVEHGRTTLNLFREYLTELNRLVREGVSAGKSLATLKGELAPERFHSLYNQDFGQTLQRNREALLGLPPGQPLEPVVSQGVEQVYYYYAQK
jgi:glyoxylase-like metal-dependent hydrolase (beta-lactamase superfamily II)